MPSGLQSLPFGISTKAWTIQHCPSGLQSLTLIVPRSTMAFPAPQSPCQEVQLQIVPYDPFDLDIFPHRDSSGSTPCWPDDADLLQHKGSCQCFYCHEKAYNHLESAAYFNPIPRLPIVQSAPRDRHPPPSRSSSLLPSPVTFSPSNYPGLRPVQIIQPEHRPPPPHGFLRPPPPLAIPTRVVQLPWAAHPISFLDLPSLLCARKKGVA